MQDVDFVQDMMMAAPGGQEKKTLLIGSKPKNTIEAGQVYLVGGVIRPKKPAAPATFYTTPNGSSYHRQGCPSIAHANNLAEVTQAEAEAAGKHACGNCIK